MTNRVTFLVCLLIAALISGASCQRDATLAPPTRDVGTVDLQVDFGGQQNQDAESPANIDVAIPCSVGSTVFTTLKRAQQNGDLKMEASGAGETAFVSSINGVGSDADSGCYWFFFVNDVLAKKGSDVVEVDPGDKIRWSFQQRPADFDATGETP